MTRIELLKSLRALVAYHRDLGIDHYEDRGGISRGMQVLAGLQQRGAAQPSAAPATGETDRQAAVSQADDGSLTLEQLRNDIARCTNCSLHTSRQIDTAGRGGDQPLLLVVGDWLVIPENRTAAAGEVLGPEQDRMLERMIQAIKLAPGTVFCTNVIKCSVPGSLRPSAEQIGVCSSYLKQQIQLLSPRIICCMGGVATHSLLQTSRSLLQLRGRFHPYRTGAGREIPLMPTFHPTFLLANPEMKQAAWQDLQAIQNMLEKQGERA